MLEIILHIGHHGHASRNFIWGARVGYLNTSLANEFCSHHQMNCASRDVTSEMMWLQFVFYFFLLFGETDTHVVSDALDKGNVHRDLSFLTHVVCT